MMQVEIGGAQGHVVQLHKPTYLIGRSRVCNLRISDEELQLVHARLKVKGDSLRLVPEDQAEVFVNGSPIDEEVELSHGDRISLGSTQLNIADVTAEPAANSEEPPQPAEQEATAHEPLPEQDHSDASEHDHTLVHAQAPNRDEQAPPKVKDWTLFGLSAAMINKRYGIAGSVLVGRARECDIRIGEAHLSRRHARLTPTTQGLVVEDLGSANGTYVNGRRIAKAVLRNGDELNLDTVKFRVEERGVSSATDETLMHSPGGRGGAKDHHGSTESASSDEPQHQPRPKGPTAIEIQQAALRRMREDNREAAAGRAATKGKAGLVIALILLAVLAGAGWIIFSLSDTALPLG